jgi:signal transduction histidine kinase
MLTHRGKSIAIKMELCDPSVDSSLSVDPTDLLSIDKFKMSQVLRNFMSNALKFTPEGGTIAVRACFIPDTTTTTMNMNNKTINDDNVNARTKQSLRFKPQPNNRGIADIETGRGRGGGGGGGGDFDGGGTHVQHGMLRVSVIDSGPGITAENQRRLFKEIIQFNPEILQGKWIRK